METIPLKKGKLAKASNENHTRFSNTFRLSGKIFLQSNENCFTYNHRKSFGKNAS